MIIVDMEEQQHQEIRGKQKRNDFETLIRRTRGRHPKAWIKYARFEMSNGFVERARTVWVKAVAQLAQNHRLWNKYIHMEEVKLGNPSRARRVFDTWVDTFLYDRKVAWISYIQFELRHPADDHPRINNRARAVFDKYVADDDSVTAWIEFANFEVKNGEVSRARNCYERAVAAFSAPPSLGEAEQLLVAYAEFEEKCCKNAKRARRIQEFARKHLPNLRPGDYLYSKFIAFDMQCWHYKVDAMTNMTRRSHYEKRVRRDPKNYGLWIEYIHVVAEMGNSEQKYSMYGGVREVYERAIANVPPADYKLNWKRYISLWINYAMYEQHFEDMEDIDVDDDMGVYRTREIYKRCLMLIPHKKFTFGKIWISAVELEIRQKNLEGARQILERAIGMGMAPRKKHKICKRCIDIGLQLSTVDCCRTLYDKYLEWAPGNYCTWCKYAEMERSLCETERVRSIFERGLAQPTLDKPELLWKAYIDMEILEREYVRVRQLYRRLLDRTKDLKVWMSYAKFEEEASAVDEGQEHKPASCLLNARKVFEEAVNYYRTCAPELREERAKVLEEWFNMESRFANLGGDVSLVRNELLQKKRKMESVDASDAAATGDDEEYYEYVFPEDSNFPDLAVLEMSDKWKKQKHDV